MRILLALLLLLVLAPAALAQREGLLQIDDPLSWTLQRQRVLGTLPGAFLGTKPLNAYRTAAYADSALAHPDRLAPVDRALLERYTGRAAGPGVPFVRRYVPFLYSNGSSFYAIRTEDYGFEVTPLAYLSFGQAHQTERPDQDPTVSYWQNTRGLRAAGHIGSNVFFEARLEENQVHPVRVRFENGTAPRLGNVKVNERTGLDTYDYFLATGVVGFRSRHFEARFGRDRNRWGFGRNSYLLSNYAAPYDHLQLHTRFWRIQYSNLFAQFTDPLPPDAPGGTVRPRKYGAFHRLAVDLPYRIQLELFESVIFAPDSAGAGGGFDFAYLNPLIFYRAVEHDRGSPDNAMLGGGLSWIVTPGVEVYSQLLLDELRLSEITNDWWGNKWGLLLGLYLVDPGYGTSRLRGFDLRVEYARQRPYLYSHRFPASAFVHFDDVLGHAAGPNSVDVSVFARYRPVERLEAALDLAFTRRGRNAVNAQGDTLNYGSDPRLSYDTRIGDHGIETLQGVRQNVLLLEGRLAYELLPDLFAEAVLRIESVDDAEDGVNRYLAPFLSLRWGLPFQSLRY